MSELKVSSELLKQIITNAFCEGQSWGVTYSTWFTPTTKDHNEKIKAAIDNAENLLMGKESKQ